VSTLGFARALRAKRPTVSAAAACALPLLASIAIAAAVPTSAQAQEVETGGCVFGGGAISCASHWAPYSDPYIRTVPPPADAQAHTLSRERERRWVQYCRPVIRQDRYGVPRYYYAQPGCEFGLGEY
jgi:hypothetical protein